MEYWYDPDTGESVWTMPPETDLTSDLDTMGGSIETLFSNTQALAKLIAEDEEQHQQELARADEARRASGSVATHSEVVEPDGTRSLLRGSNAEAAPDSFYSSGAVAPVTFQPVAAEEAGAPSTETLASSRSPPGHLPWVTFRQGTLALLGVWCVGVLWSIFHVFFNIDIVIKPKSESSIANLVSRWVMPSHVEIELLHQTWPHPHFKPQAITCQAHEDGDLRLLVAERHAVHSLTTVHAATGHSMVYASRPSWQPVAEQCLLQAPDFLAEGVRGMTIRCRTSWTAWEVDAELPTRLELQQFDALGASWRRENLQGNLLSDMRRWGRRRISVHYEENPVEPAAADGLRDAETIVEPTREQPNEQRRLLPPPKLRSRLPLVDPAMFQRIGKPYRSQSEIEIASGAAIPASRISGVSAWPTVVGGEHSDDLAAYSPAEVSQLVQLLESELGPHSARKARRDQHARRQPIACGVQIISGHSCSYACRYCYIQDWYPFIEPTPTQMSGQEVLLSLLSNPNWIPSRDFIILGDVCDPFHPNLEVRTMEYIRAVAPLGSPIQFSTKSGISRPVCEQLRHWSETFQCPINALVTITTIRHVQDLEPNAPSIQTRLDTIRALSAAGLSVFVFMRPLLPGSCEDFSEVLNAAKACGAEGVVVGSLRVSRKIYRRLRQSKTVDIETVDRQLREKGMEPSSLAEEQVDIQDEPLRAAVVSQASPWKVIADVSGSDVQRSEGSFWTMPGQVSTNVEEVLKEYDRRLGRIEAWHAKSQEVVAEPSPRLSSQAAQVHAAQVLGGGDASFTSAHFTLKRELTGSKVDLEEPVELDDQHPFSRMWMNARLQHQEMFDQDLLQSIYERSGQRARNRVAVFGGGLMGILSMPFGPIGMAAGGLFGALAPRHFQGCCNS
ncbi:unnamed protein product [Symbiodinium sp. CCMP2592]|nr:unnamed protein product [Symbiodinium sp. CCMP2592]